VTPKATTEGSSVTEEPNEINLVCSEVWGGNMRSGLVNECAPVHLPGLRCALYTKPCMGSSGGDLVFLSACGSGRMARIVVGDVSGHGEDVSHIGTWLHKSIRRHINSRTPSHIFTDLNALVDARGVEALTTAVCLDYNGNSGELAFCYAGCHPVVHYDAREKRWRELPAPCSDPDAFRNAILGVTTDTGFDIGKTALPKGDALLIYTDGVIETPGADGGLFGVERLLAWLERADPTDPDALALGLVAELEAFSGKRPLQHDDITLLAAVAEQDVRGPLLWNIAANRVRRMRRGPLPSGS